MFWISYVLGVAFYAMVPATIIICDGSIILTIFTTILALIVPWVIVEEDLKIIENSNDRGNDENN